MGTTFPAEVIELTIRLVMEAATSFRSASSCVELFYRLYEGRPFAAPSHVTVQNFILRLGLYELQRPKEFASDWIWIVDHTVQLGKTKYLVIVGIRFSQWVALNRPLEHRDLQILALEPVQESNGNVINEQLQRTANRYGIPLQILSDEGTDLVKAYDSFLGRCPGTIRNGDIAHHVATVFRRLLDKNSRWTEFVAESGRTKAKLQQTQLAHLIPPTPKNKARYMNIDELTSWGQKVLGLLEASQEDRLSPSQQQDLPSPLLEEKLGWIQNYQSDWADWAEMARMGGEVRQLLRVEGYSRASLMRLEQVLSNPRGPLSTRFVEEILTIVRAETAQIPENTRRLASSEVLESLIGKGKRLEGQQSRSGFTRNILSMAAAVVPPTIAMIKTALATVRLKTLNNYIAKVIPATLQAKRARDLPPIRKPEAEQKRDSLQLATIANF